MTYYFLDTSALVKRYVADEVGHAWVASLFASGAGNTLFIFVAALVETVATFCRMARSTPPRLSLMDRNAQIALFREHDAQREYFVVPVDRAVYVRAGDLCIRHPLRAYDSVQLACALTARDDAATAGTPAPVFVCADSTLLAAASTEGLATENPHDHP